MLPSPNETYVTPDEAFNNDAPTTPLRAVRPEDLAARSNQNLPVATPTPTRSRPNPSTMHRQVDPVVVAQALEEYVNAPDWQASRQVVEAHPELLSHTALMLLRANGVRVSEQVGPGAAQILGRYLQALEVAQREGIDFAFETVPSPFEQAFAPDLDALLAQLEAPAARDLALRVELCQAALPLAARDQLDELWAALQRELGVTLPRLMQGDHAANVEEAIAALDGALGIFTRFEFPTDWGMCQQYLGMAFLARENGDRGQNIEQAIEYFVTALQVRTQEAMPFDWATTQEALGSAYFYRLYGQRAENVDSAIASFEAALKVRTRERSPYEWATDQLSLGNAYGQRVNGTRMGNLEQAITGFEAALTYFTRDQHPEQWSLIHHNLGVAYMDRLLGNRAENVERAIEHYEMVARVQTLQRAPLEWADTRNNLGNAYRERQLGDHAANLQQAVRCYQDALRVRTRDAFLLEHRRTARNLGTLLFELGRWSEAHDVLASALGASETLYVLGLGSGGPSARLRDHAELVAMDAIALAKLGRPRDAAQRLEEGRSRALDEMLERDRLALMHSANHEARSAFERAQAGVQAALEDAQRAATTQSERNLNLTAAQAALESAIATLRSARPDFLHPPLSFKQISNAANGSGAASGPGAAQSLIYLVTSSQGTMALIIAPGKSAIADEQILWVPSLTSARLASLAPGASDAESTVKTWLGQLPRPEALDTLLSVLGRELMAPLAQRLQALADGPLSGARAVTLIAGGKLATLPLHAAVIGTVVPTRDAEGELAETRADATFVDAFEVSYSPSAQRLLAARAGASITLRNGVAAIGNPQPADQAMPWSEHEAEAVAQVTNRAGQSCTLLIRRQATTDAVTRAIRDRAYIHLACANAFYPDRPLDSYVNLAGDDALKLIDIFNGPASMRGVRLVVLSAGQSAMTAMGNGPDESVGMAAALMAGGAAGVVTSLWPASDLATLLLMRRFAEHYLSDTQPPALALRNAQRWLRTLPLETLQKDFATDIAREPDLNLADFSLPKDCPYAHPLYWAGFVLYGV